MTPETAQLAATALHLGFQLTVTVLVYPALARTDPDRWVEVHGRHSRGITPVVALVYAALLAAGGWSLATGPDAAGALSVAAVAATLAVTALLAAPLHGRLTEADPHLLRRLLVVDRVRAGLAVLAVVLAVVSQLRSA